MALAEDAARLRQVPLFATMEADALRLLAFACETRILPGGARLFARGAASEGGYLVLSGAFAVVDDQERRSIARAGTVLAEPSLVREVAHSQDAAAVETATVFKVPRAAVLRVLEEHPASAQRVLAFYARRLHGALKHDRLAAARRADLEL